MKKLLLIGFILCLLGCTDKTDDPTKNELTKEQQQILLQEQLSVYEDLINFCKLGTSTKLEGFAEACDYQGETKYFISDPIYIYDFSSEQTYTLREGKYYFIVFRDNKAINHHSADINRASISLENLYISNPAFQKV